MMSTPLTNEIDTLRQQRDELAAALKLAVKCLRKAHYTGTERDTIDAVLAKVRHD
jgi:hypothetical protein